MKKTLSMLLMLSLLLTASVFAQAEPAGELPEVTVDFESLQYEGIWWEFSGTNLMLYLPSDWIENTEIYAGGADYEFAVTPADETAYLNIRLFLDDSTDDYATRFDDMLQEVSASDAARDVTPVNLNGIDMITYSVDEDTGMGAVILADDSFIMLESVPATDENAALFIQILSTFKLAEE